MDHPAKLKLDLARDKQINAAIFDADGNLIDFSLAASLLPPGITESQIMRDHGGTRWHEFVHDDDLPRVKAFFVTTQEMTGFRYRGYTGWLRIIVAKKLYDSIQFCVFAVKQEQEACRSVVLQ